MKLKNSEIRQILDELYQLDSGLRAHESALVEMINRLTALAPNTKFDEAFAAELRARIMAQAHELQINVKPKLSIFNFTYMKVNKFTYAAAGAALAIVLIIVPAVVYLTQPEERRAGNLFTGTPSDKVKLAFEPKISRVAANFFGKLSSVVSDSNKGATSEAAGQGSVSAIAAPVAGIGRGGGGGGGGQVALDSKAIGIMPPYELINYKFVYKGGEFSVPSDQLDVLKRVKGATVDVDMAGLIRGLNFGLGDLGSFDGLSVQNVSLAQKSDLGYMINIMPDEGTININQNWGYWPIDRCFGDSKCFEELRVKESDVPADNELIQITDAFLAEHNIDKSIYGVPEVGLNYNWRMIYESAPDKANFYFPEAIDVTYPYLVDGKPVYDEWMGTKQGINVSVNIKARRVSTLYGLTTQNYQASPYEMENDAKKLIALAEQGGINNNVYYGEEANVKTKELELGDPVLAYFKYYSYRSNENVELIIPAYFFPIKNPPSDPNFSRKGIVIPLAKDIIAERQPKDVISPVPMPLTEPAGSDAASDGVSTELAPAVAPKAAK